MKLYQVFIIDSTGGKRESQLRSTLESQVKEFTVSGVSLSFLSPGDLNQIQHQYPLAVIVFGGGSFSNIDIEAINELAILAFPIFPVVEDLKHFSLYIPTILHSFNGTEVLANDTKMDRLSGLVLESLSLLRGTRRLFISYLRTESRRAAIQLYQELDSRNYDVFLDTHSVPKGAVFQDVLWHRMTDSDLVIFMHTTGAESSFWVREEIDKVNQMGITVLEVIWPDVKRDTSPIFHLFTPFYLFEGDFEATKHIEGGLEFSDTTLTKILNEVERLRARSVAARQANLAQTLCDMAETAGIPWTIQDGTSIDLHGKNGVVRVFTEIGVPQSKSFHDITLRDPASNSQERKLLYDSQYVLDSWQDHLDWLDKCVPAKRILRTDLFEWIRSLK